MSRCAVLAAGALLALVLVGCAPAPVRPDRAQSRAQAARADALAHYRGWTIRARLGVSDGHHGGSGSLVWVRDGRHYDFELQAPVTGRSFRLRGDDGQVTLEGLKQGTLTGRDARALLHRALGWNVPVAQLDYWVRGLSAPGSPGRLLFGSDGLPARLEQDGWTVEYKDWYRDTEPALPRRVFARRGDDRVRVLINSWSLR